MKRTIGIRQVVEAVLLGLGIVALIAMTFSSVYIAAWIYMVRP
jgi:cell division protein FtsL